jgi:hypothetical protein
VFAAAVRAGADLTVADAASRAMIPPAGDPNLAALRAARAAEAGLRPDEAVAAAYAAVPAPTEIAPGASRLDTALDSPEGAREALLYQLAIDPAEAPDQRAQAIAASLESIRSAPGFMLASRLLLPALNDLPADAGRDDALLFASAAAAAGDADLGRRWLDAGTARPAATPATIDPATGAPTPLGVAQPWTPPDPADVAAVEALLALYAESPEAVVNRLGGVGDAELRFVDAVVLDALGKSAEPDLRLALLRGEGSDGERADSNLLLAMESAAAAEAMAETALLAAAALGEGPSTLVPGDMARVLRALVETGLDADAREAGLEAMLAARLQ